MEVADVRFCRVECVKCLRGKDDGHSIVENTLPKQQRIQVDVYF